MLQTDKIFVNSFMISLVTRGRMAGRRVVDSPRAVIVFSSQSLFRSNVLVVGDDVSLDQWNLKSAVFS